MSDISTERVLLAALLKDKDYLKNHIQHLKKEYFQDPAEQRILRRVVEYVGKYNRAPEKSVLVVEVKADRGIGEKQSEKEVEVLNDIFSVVPPENAEWLVDTTKKFIKERSVYNALQLAVSIYQGENQKLKVEAIPDILMQAINVEFDVHVGLDYFNAISERWDFYHTPENRIPFRINSLNDITRGGVPRKTFNAIVGGTNVGKSYGLCSIASDYIRDGLNVLYISCEMREEDVAARIDQNLLGMTSDSILKMEKETFTGRLSALAKSAYGSLIIKEFATGTASAMDVQNTIDELRVRKGFVPDVVICDYITIMTSYKVPNESNSYNLYKAVSQELRAMAVRNDLILWTACQFNRGGIESSDAGLSELSESAAIAHIADFMIALFRTEELDQAGQILGKQLKNRYSNKARRTKFILGSDIDRQTLYDVDAGKSTEIIDSPAFIESQASIKEKFMGLK